MSKVLYNDKVREARQQRLYIEVFESQPKGAK